MAEPTRAAEAAAKVSSLRALLRARGADALVLTRIPNFAWLSCGGRSFINVAAEGGAAWIVVTPARVTALTTNIEAERLRDEELSGLDWEVAPCDWWAAGGLAAALRGLVGTAALVLCDAGVPGATEIGAEIAALRTRLSAAEGACAAQVGRLTAEALEACCQTIQPGETEFAVAGRLAAGCYERGIEPIVHLVAFDERAYTRRHPLPTMRRLERHALVVVCGLRAGLVLSASRLVHFGPVAPDLERRWHAAAQVDAAMIAATTPGATAGQVFAAALAAYRATGFNDEWRQHHQGGLAGYASREWRAEPEGPQVIEAGQIFAWNPSVAGAKSEDTVLCRADGLPAVLTETGAWPLVEFPTPAGPVRRPAMLQR